MDASMHALGDYQGVLRVDACVMPQSSSCAAAGVARSTMDRGWPADMPGVAHD